MSQFSTKEFEEKKKEDLDDRLLELKNKQKDEMAQRKAVRLGVPYIDLIKAPIGKDAVVLIPEAKAKEAKLVAFYLVKDVVKIGAVEPESEETKKVIKEMEDETGYSSNIFLISEPGLERGLDVYNQIVKVRLVEEVGLSAEELEKAQAEIKNLEALKKRIKEVSTTELVNIIIAGSISMGASDIHIEPEENTIMLRYRIDGILHEIAELPRDIYEKLMSRIKLIARLKINVDDRPQDGRISVKLVDKDIDLRISTLPTGYGESTVMRLLGTGAIELKISQLGFRKRDQDLLLKLLKKPTGMILTTGPTGSGKTTTLYSFINEIQSTEIKIITLENPIEYKLAGIQQTPIDAEKGMTFASGLRAILRQDPDVVMIGEIRDLETAEIAAQAALTGHLVFSTLHTNDASGAIPRMINMGLRPFSLGPALSGVIGQRLIRKLCPDCKVEYAPTAEELKNIKGELGTHFPKSGAKKLFKPLEKGCKTCGDIGYKGRLGIYEIIEVTEGIIDLINKRAAALEIFRQAKSEGMTTMKQDGYLKVIEGITSIDEVDRVI